MGVYKYLEEMGLKPDVVVGTSIGAVNGAMIVSGMGAADLEREWRKLTSDQIQKLRLNPLDYLRHPSLLDNSPWLETLERQISFHRVRTSPVILRVVATDIRRGRVRIFRNEEITVRHILASCSIPVVYPWTEIDGDLFWDGAVVANTPLAPAIDEAGASDEAYFRWNARILRNTGLVNFLDGCAATLPCQVPGEAPVGLSVCGVALSDRHVLAVASAIERALAPPTGRALAGRG